MKCGGGDRGDWVDGVNNTFSILDFTSFKYVTSLLKTKVGMLCLPWPFGGGGERDYQFKIRNMFIDKQNWVRRLSLLLGVEGEAENGKAK